MVKATAVAHPIQGLVKYHGLLDERLRLPFHDSISVCTAPLTTRTTIEFGDFPRDTAAVDGRPLGGHELARVLAVTDEVRRRSGHRERFRMESVNDFPSNVGLGASASGFAALAAAACAAVGLELPPKEVSTIARRGAGSATRSVTGGFSRWRRGGSDEDSFSEVLAGPELPMSMIVALVPAYKQTEDAHREVLTSPFFQARLAEVPRLLLEMELAIRERSVPRIAEVAERDTLLLHGTTMTGRSEMFLWRPETVAVIHRVRRLRDEGVPAFFSIDTGATVYVNSPEADAAKVESAIREVGVPTIRCTVGGPSRLIEEHLF